MANVCDVAAYIIEQKGPVTAWKLQKLAYYSQAWSLVWDETPLFENRIEAWANGPVSPDLYREHRGQFYVNAIPGDASALTEEERATVDAVIEYYGDKTSQWLSDLSHFEAPWREARIGIPDGVPSNREITWEAMAGYYGALPADAM